MGKWILYSLILLNILAFLWFYSGSSPEPVMVQQKKPLLNSELIRIVKNNDDASEANNHLVKEQTNNSLQAEPDSSLQASQEPETGGVEEEEKSDLPVVASEDNNQLLGDVKATPETQSPVIEDSIAETKLKPTPKPKIVNNSTATNEKKSDTSVVTTAEEQKLLDEMASFAQNSNLTQSSENTNTPQNALPLPVKMLCYQYGPLNNSQADAISAVMKQQKIPVVQQSRILVEPRGFLVLIMPQKNSAAAKSEMRVARKAGMDAFTITKGEWNNGVSLGIFSAKENANKLFNQAKKLLPKSKVAIQKRVRETEVFRILFKLQEDQDPAILLANNTFPRFDSKNPLQITTKVAKKSCETVEF